MAFVVPEKTSWVFPFDGASRTLTGSEKKPTFVAMFTDVIGWVAGTPTATGVELGVGVGVGDGVVAGVELVAAPWLP